NPEEGENFNIGVTWDLTDTFTTRLDLWRINFTDLVGSEDGEEIFLADIADGTIDDPRILISPLAGTNAVADLTANDFEGIRLSYENRDIQETQGVDFGLDWRPTLGQNEFRVALEGTWFDYHRFHNTATDEILDTIGTYQGGNRPDWQTNLRMSWRRDGHFLQGILRQTPALQNAPNQPQDSLIEELSYTQLDLMYSYTFEDYGLSIRGGVRNVWDERTPINPSALSTTVSRLYDPRGRIYNLGFTYSL
ncbi:MAG: TonB-dependent receptor, partial [Pseudohongiellaceae bacterium]